MADVYRDAYEVLASAIRSAYQRDLGLVENISADFAKDVQTAPAHLDPQPERAGSFLLFVGSAQALRRLKELVETLDEGIRDGDIKLRD